MSQSRQNHVDSGPGLLLKSSSPNWDANQMSLKKQDELKRQVSKLIEQGYIRKSKSPSVVLGLRP